MHKGMETVPQGTGGPGARSDWWGDTGEPGIAVVINGGMVDGGSRLGAMFSSGVAGSPATLATVALSTPLPSLTVAKDLGWSARFGSLVLPVLDMFGTTVRGLDSGIRPGLEVGVEVGTFGIHGAFTVTSPMSFQATSVAVIVALVTGWAFALAHTSKVL